MIDFAVVLQAGLNAYEQAKGASEPLPECQRKGGIAAVAAMIPPAVPCPEERGHGLHCSPACPFHGEDDQNAFCTLRYSLPVSDPQDKKVGKDTLRFYSYCRVPGPSCPAVSK